MVVTRKVHCVFGQFIRPCSTAPGWWLSGESRCSPNTSSWDVLKATVSTGVARFSVESSGSRMDHFMTPSFDSQVEAWLEPLFPAPGEELECVCTL